MKTPSDVLRRLGENVKFSAPDVSATLTQAQVLGALGRMDPSEAHSALDELEQGVEVARLKQVWDLAGKINPELRAAMGEEFGGEVEAAVEFMRTAKGEARRRGLKKLKSLSHRIQRSIDADRQKVIEKAKRIERYERAAAEVNRFLHGPRKLQRLEGSHFRRLLEAEQVGNVFTSIHKGVENMMPGIISELYGDASVFVVEHDWARAFESAPDVFNGAVTMPDTQCIFEFCISGHIVVALIGMINDHPTILPFIRCKDDVWVTIGTMLSKNGQIGFIKPLDAAKTTTLLIHDAYDSVEGHFIPLPESAETFWLYELIDRQVRAVGVALDAEVAVKTAIRMPYRSNQPPKGPSKPKPFYSYHTVSLARRSARLEPREDDGLEVKGPKRRLHFRRGHFRHFDGWKTWVNWCLVGDPDLGFVDKHYKL